MSSPINSYGIRQVYNTSQIYGSNTKSVSKDSESSASQKKQTDSAQFSPEAMMYLSQSQQQEPYLDPLSETNKSEMTIDQKKETLERIQAQLDQFASDDIVNEEMDQKFAEVSKLLASYDSATATDEEVSALFDQATEKMESAAPPRPPGGMMPPPPPREEVDSTDSSSDEDLAALLTQLQELLDKGTDEEDSDLISQLSELFEQSTSSN